MIKLRRLLSHPALLPTAVILLILLSMPSLRSGFMFDDFVHRETLAGSSASSAAMNLFAFIRSPADVQRYLDVGGLPWWTDPNLRVSFWRPVSALTHWLDNRLWPDNAPIQHAHNIAWGAAMVLLAGLAYRRLPGAGAAAGLSTLLFAMDDAHHGPIAWIANRNSLIACAFGFGSLLCHDHWRRHGSRAAALLAAVLFALSLLSAEFGLGVLAYLFAYAYFLDPAPTFRRRMTSLLPYAAAFILWQSLYRALGFGTGNSGLYIDAMASPIQFARHFPRNATLLLEGQWGCFPSELFPFFAPRLQAPLFVGSIAYLLLIAALMIPLLRATALARFFATGMLLCLLPVAATAPADRLLLFSGFGAFGLIALFVRDVFARQSGVPRARVNRFASSALAIVLLFIHGPWAAMAFPAQILAMQSFADQTVSSGGPGLANEHDLERQTLVCPATPGPFFFAMTYVTRQGMHRRAPARILGLAAATTTVTVERLNDSSVRISPQSGFLAGPVALPGNPAFSIGYGATLFDFLYRPFHSPILRGTVTQTAGVEILVTETDPSGRPLSIEAQFPQPADNPIYRWVTFTGGKYYPFILPEPGHTKQIPPSRW